MPKNKRIVLTGADSGIGLEVLKLFAAEPTNRILAVDRNVTAMDKFGENVTTLRLDVSSGQAVDEIFARAQEILGGIDIFYANAGYPYYELVDSADWERTKRMFETNVFSPIYSYQKYREYLNGAKGCFAVTVSAIGKMAMPGYTLYSASKFAMHGFQQGLRFELPDNITMTCLYPIATDTGFFKAANEKEFEKPFPVQNPAVVAKKMVKGIDKGKRTVNPSGLFTLSTVLFSVLPFTKSIYLRLERAKLARFAQSIGKEF